MRADISPMNGKRAWFNANLQTRWSMIRAPDLWPMAITATLTLSAAARLFRDGLE